MPCNEVARYRTTGTLTVKYVCGIHSKREHRKVLSKNPRASELQAATNKSKKREADALAERNAGGVGSITATKMRMMRKPVPQPGHLAVFPNNRHAHSYGYESGDFSALSPMQLGPVMSDDGATVVARNIENYHQFAKVFPQEQEAEMVCDCGRPFAHNRPSQAYHDRKREAYADPVPHRHKFGDLADMKRANKSYVNDGNINAPMYTEQNGRHYTYVESRYFYCHQMEVLATQTAAFAKLMQYYNNGYAIELFGYDAYPPTMSLWEHYCDASKPFGHELVILTLVRMHDTPDEYPWRRYRREHAELY